jgi:hypothetical protein
VGQSSGTLRESTTEIEYPNRRLPDEFGHYQIPSLPSDVGIRQHAEKVHKGVPLIGIECLRRRVVEKDAENPIGSIIVSAKIGTPMAASKFLLRVPVSLGALVDRNAKTFGVPLKEVPLGFGENVASREQESSVKSAPDLAGNAQDLVQQLGLGHLHHRCDFATGVSGIGWVICAICGRVYPRRVRNVIVEDLAASRLQSFGIAARREQRATSPP